MRTVGLIVGALALGGFVALWWRDAGTPENGSPPAAEGSYTQDQRVSETEAAAPAPTPPEPVALSTAGQVQPAGKEDASSTEEPPSRSSPPTGVAEPNQAFPRQDEEISRIGALEPSPMDPQPVALQTATQHRPAREGEALPAIEPAPVPSVEAGETDLAALEIADPESVTGPRTENSGTLGGSSRFRERPAKVAHLSSESMEGRVYFALDQHLLEPEAVVALEGLISELARAHQVLRLVVDGHCDDTGTDQYNQALSERRAEEVVEFLRERGLVVRDVLVRGHGERIPVAPGRDEDSRARNRRAEIRIDWVRRAPAEEASSAGLRLKD